MKSHVTNHTHQQFIVLLNENIQKMQEIPHEKNIQVSQKITELNSNKQALEETYANYQLKLKELSNLLDDYETTKQVARINLRKIQLWLKFTYSKLIKNSFNIFSY